LLATDFVGQIVSLERAPGRMKKIAALCDNIGDRDESGFKDWNVP